MARTFEMLKEDADEYFKRWTGRPSLGSWVRLCLLTPGFQLGVCIRFQAVVGRVPVIGKVIRRVVWYLSSIYFGCDIDPMATFKGGLYLPHPTGIVIGGEWDVGSRVAISQGVTLGRRSKPTGRAKVGDDVIIGAGACLIGQFAVGSRVKVGANAVVVGDVPDDCSAVGVPARIIPPKEVD